MSSTISKEDFSKICRTCLGMQKELVSIVTNDLSKMLQFFSKIQSSNNELPQQICSDCAVRTYETFKFAKQCESSEKILEEILLEHDDKTWFDNSDEKAVHDHESDHESEMDCKENVIKNEIDSHEPMSHSKIKSDIQSGDEDKNDSYMHLSESESELDFKVSTNPELRNSKISLRKSRIDWVMTLNPEKCDTTALLCKICNKTLVNLNSLARHMETHDTNRKYSVICTICNKGFYEKGNYMRHMLRHKREAKYNCDKCSKSFYELNTLASHLQKTHNVPPLTCSKCDKTFYISEQLDLHMKKHTNQFEHICKHCGKGYFLIRRLEEHIRTHEQIYMCEICNKTYKNHASLNKHNFRYHKTVQEKKICQICGKTVLHMKAHMLIHNGTRTFECSDCNKSFIHRSDLVAHCKRKHRTSDEPPILPYLCNICGKRKLSNAALQQHIIYAHTTEKTQRCHLCEKFFKTENALKSHIRYSHKDVRNYKCNTCGKGFYTNAILRNHLRTHTGERPFVCAICNRAFGKNSTLKTHMKIHSTADSS